MGAINCTILKSKNFLKTQGRTHTMGATGLILLRKRFKYLFKCDSPMTRGLSRWGPGASPLNLDLTEPMRCMVFIPDPSARAVAQGIAIGAGGVGFNSWAGQIGHKQQRLTTEAMFLRICVAQALSRGEGPRTRYTLRRNTASIMKILIFDIFTPLSMKILLLETIHLKLKKKTTKLFFKQIQL